MKSFCLGLVVLASTAAPLLAQDHVESPPLDVAAGAATVDRRAAISGSKKRSRR